MRISKKVAAGAGGGVLALGLGLGVGACSQVATGSGGGAPASTPTSGPAAASGPASAAVPASPQAAPAAPAPAAGYFVNTAALSQSVASQQADALAAAPADDYTSGDDASISITCTPDGTPNQFSCSGSDSDGDTATGDTVTVASDGSSWSDTGMRWSGPDVYPDGGVTNYWTTPAVSGYTGT
jgi:hypothetical protein